MNSCGKLLCCWLWWFILAVPVSSGSQGWRQGGPLKSRWRFQFSSRVQTNTGTQVLHGRLPASPAYPHCAVLNQHTGRSNHYPRNWNSRARYQNQAFSCGNDCHPHLSSRFEILFPSKLEHGSEIQITQRKLHLKPQWQSLVEVMQCALCLNLDYAEEDVFAVKELHKPVKAQRKRALCCPGRLACRTADGTPAFGS